MRRSGIVVSLPMAWASTKRKRDTCTKANLELVRPDEGVARIATLTRSLRMVESGTTP